MAVVKLSFLVVLAVVVVVVWVPNVNIAEAQGLTCNTVTNSLLTCVGYLRNGGKVPGNCCSGVQYLNRIARSTPDRQTACKCLQRAAVAFGITPRYAQSLPSACGVNIPYKISPSTDCSRVR